MKTKEYQHLINKYRTHALTSVYNTGLRDMAQLVLDQLKCWSITAEGGEAHSMSHLALYVYLTKVLQEVEQ